MSWRYFFYKFQQTDKNHPCLFNNRHNLRNLSQCPTQFQIKIQCCGIASDNSNKNNMCILQYSGRMTCVRNLKRYKDGVSLQLCPTVHENFRCSFRQFGEKWNSFKIICYIYAGAVHKLFTSIVLWTVIIKKTRQFLCEFGWFLALGFPVFLKKAETDYYIR